MDVVAWHGNYAPYKYDLRRFNTIGSVSFDHPDPSIFLVLRSGSDTPGVDNVDFVVFPPRWLAMEDTFRPPWFHRNVASEFMGLVSGVYDAKHEGFVPGGASLHNCMSGHGPDADTFERALVADTSVPQRTGDGLAFMFETRWLIKPTNAALKSAQLQHEYFVAGKVCRSASRRLHHSLEANDARLTSFVDVPRGSHFPIQNLPYGMFSTEDDRMARPGIAIGEYILDLHAVAAAGALQLDERERHVFDEPGLAGVLAAGRAGWRRIRERISTLLRSDTPHLRDDRALRVRALRPAAQATLHLPVRPAGFTDFYSSREHATNVGTLFRGPQNALLPNWLELPVAYNGRASSVVPSGTAVRRPSGQTRPAGAQRPSFGRSRAVDFELEVAAIVGEGNALGEPIAVDHAEAHIFGLLLLNDWSARDLQQWEYQPLGPFNSKSFATSISPWIVTLDALEPFRIPGPRQDPEPLDYLRERRRRGFDIALDVALRHPGARANSVVTRSNFKHVYWSVAQQLAHHTVSGCNTLAGDLLASGTVSGPDASSLGCLLELTAGGTQPLVLTDGITRTYLEDDDEVIMTGYCAGPAYGIGFGEVRGRIIPARRSFPPR